MVLISTSCIFVVVSALIYSLYDVPPNTCRFVLRMLRLFFCLILSL